MGDMRAHRDWQAKCMEITEECAQSEIARLTAQRDRLRECVLSFAGDDLFCGGGPEDRLIEHAMNTYDILQPGDMTSD